MIWDILDDFEPVWTILKQFEQFWSSLNHLEPFWTNMKQFEPFWISLIHFETVWTILNQFIRIKTNNTPSYELSFYRKSQTHGDYIKNFATTFDHQWTLVCFDTQNSVLLFIILHLFLFVGNVLLSSETDPNHIKDPWSVLEWSYPLPVQNSTQHWVVSLSSN